jgi:hypothetical protein
MSPMNRRTSTPPATPHSYVVRIYRRTAQGLVGQVQDVQTGTLRAFRSLAGLWSALGGRPSSGTRTPASKEKRR